METSTCSKERRYPGFLSSQMCFSHISALEKFSIIKSSVTPLRHLSSGWCLLFHVKLLRWLSWQSRAVAPSCYWRANNPFVYSTKLLKYYSKTQTYLFFVQSFCLCLLLWLVEVVQRRVVDGQSHWLLTLDVNDLNHWSLLLIVFQMEPGEMKVWNSVKKKATVLSITKNIALSGPPHSPIGFSPVQSWQLLRRFQSPRLPSYQSGRFVPCYRTERPCETGLSACTCM